MDILSFSKVTALPDTLNKNTLYFLESGDQLQIYVSDKTGAAVKHLPTLVEIQAFIAQTVQEIQQNQDIGTLQTQLQQLAQNQTAMQQTESDIQNSIDYIGGLSSAASTDADAAKTAAATATQTANTASTASASAVTTSNQALSTAQATAQAMGTLANLESQAKDTVVSAINELVAKYNQLQIEIGATILDTATTGDTTHTWSANQIISYVQSIQQAILGGADAAYDTLKEIETILQNNSDSITNILTALSGCLQVGQAQTFTTAQMIQGCTNLGIGDPTTDLLAYYQGL